MSSADERIINRLDRIAAAQGGGGAAFAEITGDPNDNAALQAALAAKVPTSRTVNGQALSGNVVVTGLLLETSGVPDNGDGADGDWSFDKATKTIYGPKAAGVWPAGVVLGATSSGGVIGTAIITITGGDTVESVVNSTGVLSGVVGGYAFGSGALVVTFPAAQPDAFYIPDCTVESSASTMIRVSDNSATAAGFTFDFHDKNGSAISNEISKIRITVSRLSQ